MTDGRPQQTGFDHLMAGLRAVGIDIETAPDPLDPARKAIAESLYPLCPQRGRDLLVQALIDHIVLHVFSRDHAIKAFYDAICQVSYWSNRAMTLPELQPKLEELWATNRAKRDREAGPR